MKIEDIKYKEGRAYVKTWVNALDVLLGWSEKRTLAWAERFWPRLNDEDDLLFHRTPAEYITGLIIPKPLNKTLTAEERFELCKLLLRTVERFGPFSCDERDFDWHLTKRLVERVLRQVKLLKISGGGNIQQILRSKRRKLEARMRLRATRRSKISKKHLREILREGRV